MIKILLIGDTYGEPGRKAVELFVPAMKREGQVDFVVCNAENAAGGAGLTTATAEELLAAGADVVTTGNHVWDKREIASLLARDRRILRPAN